MTLVCPFVCLTRGCLHCMHLSQQKLCRTVCTVCRFHQGLALRQSKSKQILSYLLRGASMRHYIHVLCAPRNTLPNMPRPSSSSSSTPWRLPAASVAMSKPAERLADQRPELTRLVRSCLARIGEEPASLTEQKGSG